MQASAPTTYSPVGSSRVCCVTLLLAPSRLGSSGGRQRECSSIRAPWHQARTNDRSCADLVYWLRHLNTRTEGMWIYWQFVGRYEEGGAILLNADLFPGRR